MCWSVLSAIKECGQSREKWFWWMLRIGGGGVTECEQTRTNKIECVCVFVECLPLVGSTGRGCTTSVYSTSGSLVTTLLSSSLTVSKYMNNILCKTSGHWTGTNLWQSYFHLLSASYKINLIKIHESSAVQLILVSQFADLHPFLCNYILAFAVNVERVPAAAVQQVKS